MLGVDIGSHSVKVIEMGLRKGVPVISGAAIEEFTGDTIDERQATINAAVAKFKNKWDKIYEKFMTAKINF